jgi:hypothetical protein
VWGVGTKVLGKLIIVALMPLRLILLDNYPHIPPSPLKDYNTYKKAWLKFSTIIVSSFDPNKRRMKITESPAVT